MNQQKGLAPLLIILLIAAALGGYLIYTNYSNNRIKETVPIATLQPITQPSTQPSLGPSNQNPLNPLNVNLITPPDWIRIDCDQSVNFSSLDINGGAQSCATEPGAFAINVFTAKDNGYENQEIRNDSNNVFSNYRSNLSFGGKSAIQYNLKILEGQPAGLYKYTVITLGNEYYLYVVLNNLKYDSIYQQFLGNMQFK